MNGISQEEAPHTSFSGSLHSRLTDLLEPLKNPGLFSDTFMTYKRVNTK